MKSMNSRPPVLDLKSQGLEIQKERFAQWFCALNLTKHSFRFFFQCLIY